MLLWRCFFQRKMKKLYIETYGCQMNVADSEVVASVMQMAGYGTTESLDEADAILINTCSVRDNAEQRIFARLGQLNALRRRRPRRLIVGVIGGLIAIYAIGYFKAVLYRYNGVVFINDA